jgi:tRNA pseudouridine38-40 synthase
VGRDGAVVTFGFRANAFLHQMVRTVVGTLVRVGEGKLEPDDVRTMLGARERAVISQPAPARGLTLVRVTYGRRSEAGVRP